MAALWVILAVAVNWVQLLCKWTPLVGSEWEKYSCNPFDGFDPPLQHVGFVVGPPIVLLLLGGLFFWAFKRFRM